MPMKSLRPQSYQARVISQQKLTKKQEVEALFAIPPARPSIGGSNAPRHYICARFSWLPRLVLSTNLQEISQKASLVEGLGKRISTDSSWCNWSLKDIYCANVIQAVQKH